MTPERQPTPEKKRDVLIRISKEDYHCMIHEARRTIKDSCDGGEIEEIEAVARITRYNNEELACRLAEDDECVRIRYYFNMMTGMPSHRSYPKPKMGYHE